jgi:hypothetical protein
MPDEVWGTFSIDDHRRPRAFVADVLLYDQLVVPYPATGEEGRIWEKAWGIDLDRLERKLDILDAAGMVQLAHWSEGGATLLRERLAAAARIQDPERVKKLTQMLQHGGTSRLLADELNQLNRVPAYLHERMVHSAGRHGLGLLAGAAVDTTLPHLSLLFQHLDWMKRSPGTHVEAVAAYPSFHDFATDVELDVVAHDRVADEVDNRADERTQPAVVFGWELFVPEDGRLSDDELLRRAVKFASREDIRETRHDFHEWRRTHLVRGTSYEDALADLEIRLAAYRNASAKIKTKTRVVNAFTLLGITGSLASAMLAFPPAGIGAGLFTAARFVADQKLASSPPDPEARAVAMFHDARRHFGWREAQ